MEFSAIISYRITVALRFDKSIPRLSKKSLTVPCITLSWAPYTWFTPDRQHLVILQRSRIYSTVCCDKWMQQNDYDWFPFRSSAKSKYFWQQRPMWLAASFQYKWCITMSFMVPLMLHQTNLYPWGPRIIIDGIERYSCLSICKSLRFTSSAQH